MAMIEPIAGKPFVKKDRQAIGDISGVIGLTGASRGSIVLSFSEGAICAIVGGMLGMEFESMNDDVKDAVGELTNMISGDARRRLAEKGVIFEAGIPNIVSGHHHTIEAIAKGPVVAIPFEVKGHQFVIEASFETEF
ncbi:MAG: chemotaxis protein CheX [Nitrospinae bacterium]|nr:chemotaxis protein CheX [Nitrospinota bacterium]